MAKIYRDKDGGTPKIYEMINYLQKLYGIKKRVVMLDMMQLDASAISKIAAGYDGYVNRVLLAIHDFSGIPINEIRTRLGIDTIEPVPRKRFY
jgi:hypothetical protein